MKKLISANVAGKILDEHSIDVMSGNYLATPSTNQRGRERSEN